MPLFQSMSKCRLHTLLPLGILMLSLSACSGWWGAEDSTPPLEGKRVPVLVYDQGFKVDAQLAATPLELPPVQENTVWPTSGGFASHEGGHPQLSDQLKKAWRVDVGDSINRSHPIIPTPVVANGVIYTMDSSTQVSAFSADKGKEIWSIDLAPKGESHDASGGGLGLLPGRLFVSTGYGEVVALDTANGKEIWRQRVESPVRSAPAIAKNMVFVVTIDNRLVALSADTGDIAWTHNGLSEDVGLLGAPSPAVYNDDLLVAYSSGELFSLRIGNGQEQWADNLASIRREGGVGSIAAIRGQPVLAAGGVAAVAISNSGRLVAIDTRTGQRVWSQRISGTQMPWVAGSMVFVVSSDAQLVALDLKDGKIRWVKGLAQWTHPKDREGIIAWYGPVLAGTSLWLTNSEGQLLRFDPATGEQKGKIDAGSAFNRAPIVVGKTLYTLDDSATLAAWQ